MWRVSRLRPTSNADARFVLLIAEGNSGIFLRKSVVFARCGQRMNFEAILLGASIYFASSVVIGCLVGRSLRDANALAYESAGFDSLSDEETPLHAFDDRYAEYIGSSSF